ncbi:hypothetical protein H4R33_001513 [Dimargaris cristalligena]|nr:hypothetical protein H4R33_001513 [Dimargaris cristalligena]
MGNDPALPQFPKPADFETDPRVDVIDESGKWVFTDENDGLEYEYDPQLAAWFPLWNEALVESQQSAYGGLEEPNKRQHQSDPALKKNINRSIYVQGLPLDVTVAEIQETFGRFGIIMEDFETKLPKIKLYKKPDGTLKGDALITYFKPESVSLAITLLDESPFRPGASTNIQVAEAEFKSRESSDEKPGQPSKTKLDPRLKKQRLQKMEKKLAWYESDEPEVSDRHKRVVILKHMFTLAELEEDPTLLLDLKEEVRSECEKLGQVTAVKLFDKSEDGVISVKFVDKTSAIACVELMDGRWFGGQRVSAQLYDGKTQYEYSKSNESEEATKARLEKFAEWLEEEPDS